MDVKELNKIVRQFEEWTGLKLRIVFESGVGYLEEIDGDETHLHFGFVDWADFCYQAAHFLMEHKKANE